jgi:hypothetical protein
VARPKVIRCKHRRSRTGATASCPSTKNLLGTGGLLLDGQGQLVIDDPRPTKALSSVTVFGVEDQSGYPLNWTASAFAICANPCAAAPGANR